MSKGSRRRPGQQYSENYNKIDWSKRKSDSNYVEIKTPTGCKIVHKDSLKKRPRSHHIMPDIEPYQATGGDVAINGERPVITSRSKHREFLRRNNYEEVGNEKDYFFKHNGKSDDNPTKDW